MKLNPDQARELAKLVAQTRAEELTCDECLDRLAEFAEAMPADRATAAALEQVRHHLNICAECREEFALLLAALGIDSPPAQ